MTRPGRSLRNRITDAVPAITGGLGAASYLMALSGFYSWWTVVLFAPLAILGGVIVSSFIWPSGDAWLSRGVCCCLGVLLMHVGVVEADRRGALLMGIALVLLAVVPPIEKDMSKT